MAMAKLLNIAHRGGARLWPENTLYAFAQAARAGCDGAEFDVQLSQDGRLVVFHDYRLKPELCRSPDGHWLKGRQKLIRDLTASELRAFDVGRIKPRTLYARTHRVLHPRDGERIPLLSEVIATVRSLRKNFRLFMVRAMLDRKWASFVTRVDAWQHNTLVARYIETDLEQGKARGQFLFDRLDVATDFIMDASAYCIQTIHDGVPEPNLYMDAQVRMALTCVGCNRETCEQGVTFSLDYLQAWASGRIGAGKPKWIDKIDTKDGQRFMSYQLST